MIFDITIQMKKSISFPVSEIQVITKWIAQVWNSSFRAFFPFINIVTHQFRTSEEKNLASNNSYQLKNQCKNKVWCKVFHYPQSVFM